MYAQTLFDNQVQLFYMGRAEDDFSPRWPDFPRAIRGVKGLFKSGLIFSPRLAFTRQWLTLAEDPNSSPPGQVLLNRDWAWVESSEALGLYRSCVTADGVILPPLPPKSDGSGCFLLAISSIVGFNADCPFGVILWPDGRLGFCHLGVECLLPRDGSPSILETGGLEPGCKVHLTAGIRPCCYGRNDGGFNYVFSRFPEADGGTATKGPRKDQPSLDIHQLTRSILLKLGITDVTWDTLCTACAATPDGQRLYYSNAHNDTGRNCVAVRRIHP